jgi:hypothetical protein
MALLTSALVTITYLSDTDIGVPTRISLTNTIVAIVLVWSVTWMVGLRNRHERQVATMLSQVRGVRERAETAEAHVATKFPVSCMRVHAHATIAKVEISEAPTTGFKLLSPTMDAG